MDQPGQGPRSGARDNGLRCAAYAVVGDLDPRIADSLLETLRSEGIAAYVMPSTTSRGGYLESPPPSGLTDRLHADADRLDRAKELVEATGVKDDIDFDSAWQQVLSSLQTPSPTTATPWPSSEDVPDKDKAAIFQVPASLPAESAAEFPPGIDPADQDHFEPPPPPPLPKFRQTTVLALAAIIGGIVILATQFDSGGFDWVGIIGILGGAAALIWHMNDGPPTDSGWDDGAVV
jgi:hypothetical protein